MNKKIGCIIFILFILSGCGIADEPEAVIEIDQIKISKQDFQDEYQTSSYYHTAKENKKDFLNFFISRKLILHEAEKQGLDKDPEFLNDIQFFWEQSLLKRMISRKMKELVPQVEVSEEDIKQYFNKNKEGKFTDKELNQVYDQIRWILLQQKQKEALDNWIESLREKANIDIDYQKLEIKEEE